MATLGALRGYPILGAVFRFIGLGRGAANLLGGVLIFAGVIAGTLILMRRIHRRKSDASLTTPMRAGGAVVAAAWASLFGAFFIVLATVMPSSPVAQRGIARSLLGRTVLAAKSPIYGVLVGVAEGEARNLVLYVRQYMARFEPKKKESEPEDCFEITPSSDLKLDSAVESELLQMLNNERTNNKLKPLMSHGPIREVARKHSEDMYKRGSFCHTNPDGVDPFERIQSAGIKYVRAGENLALAPTMKMVHEGLMNSPPHRENILRPEFTDIGIGVYEGPFGFMVTQNFCSGCR